MSKFVILFCVFIAGSLYNPPRALSQLGPEAAAMGWRIKTAFYRFRPRNSRSARVNPAGSSRLEMCPAPASST